MTHRRGARGKDPDPPDDATHLTEQDVERRLGGGAGLGAVATRAPEPPVPAGKPPRPPRRARGGTVLWRDVFLVLALLGFLGVGAQFVLQRPSAALVSPPPGASSVALASPTALVAPSPTSTPAPTAIPLPSDVIGSLLPEVSPTTVPTASEAPTTTPAPGVTPKPTPRPTPPPTANLTVVVKVHNTLGGNDPASAWTVAIGGASPTKNNFAGSAGGTTLKVAAGKTYSITTTPTTPGGYSQSLSGSCTGPLPVGASATCTIAEQDRQARLRVYVLGLPDASVVQVSISGSAAPSQATFSGNASGTLVTVLSNRPYGVTATDVDGYVQSPYGTCSSAGLVEGQLTQCTYTYTTAPPPASAGFVGPLLPLLALIGRRRSVGRWARK